MARVLITGSIAYDFVMRFRDAFADHILPDKLNILNVSFTAEEMNKNFGGTAGNIAYNLKLLQESPVIFSTVGRDFDEYKKWFDENGIDTSTIHVHQNEWTASAHIITDKHDNQITAFHGGAMLNNEISILPLLESHEIAYAIVAPDGKLGMLSHTETLKQKQIPRIYDPGHSIPSCSKEELRRLMEGAFILIVNDYEENLFCQKAEMSREQLLQEVRYLIVTQKDKGSFVYGAEGEIHVPASRANQVIDPTGAGDAYRGGLLKGLLYNLPIEKCLQIASVAACYKVEYGCPQGYTYTIAEFKSRFIENYGKTPELEEIFTSG